LGKITFLKGVLKKWVRPKGLTGCQDTKAEMTVFGGDAREALSKAGAAKSKSCSWELIWKGVLHKLRNVPLFDPPPL